MYNGTMICGWLGIGDVALTRIDGTAIVARPRPEHIADFGDAFMARPSGVRQQA
jgi:hypothetical protein